MITRRWQRRAAMVPLSLSRPSSRRCRVCGRIVGSPSSRPGDRGVAAGSVVVVDMRPGYADLVDSHN